ncbi:MAG: pyrrolo-quinoline quinone, partial [Planctomycetes bacterium]|nr:pyrrolo-quinoline quinone [Planctomycetota bacterium]
ATETHVRWKQPKLVPFCSSPVFVNGSLFTVKDGGILQCLNTNTGKPTKQLRLEASGNYYSSPVYGDGKIYIADEQGRLTVLTSNEKPEVIHTADFKEDVYSTPAILDGRIYFRTNAALYCFRL